MHCCRGAVVLWWQSYHTNQYLDFSPADAQVLFVVDEETLQRVSTPGIRPLSLDEENQGKAACRAKQDKSRDREEAREQSESRRVTQAHLELLQWQQQQHRPSAITSSTTT